MASSSLGRSKDQWKSPLNNGEVASKELENMKNGDGSDEGLVVFDQDKKEIHREDSPPDQVLDTNRVPRQFMDLGLATNAADIGETMASSSLGRSKDQWKSPVNNGEVASKELENMKNGDASDEGLVVFDQDKKEIHRENSAPDQDVVLKTFPIRNRL
ncbi:unnamed protein product [Lupinus luteus]|uniref:Uncharacterized protein n=1 Tax=Lupinus luteus TaxID=3873 RepID=A0AAV1VXJ3_LUPLU